MKNIVKKFADIKIMRTFVAVIEQRNRTTKTNNKKLPCGVMVARRILVPPVRVRILPRQLKKSVSS